MVVAGVDATQESVADADILADRRLDLIHGHLRIVKLEQKFHRRDTVGRHAMRTDHLRSLQHIPLISIKPELLAERELVPGLDLFSYQLQSRGLQTQHTFR